MKKEEIAKTTEIIEVEDAIENIDGVEEIGSGNGLKTVAKIGAVVGLGYLGYRFIVKPIVAKIKAKKEQVIEAEEFEVTDAENTVYGENDTDSVVKFNKKK